MNIFKFIWKLIGFYQLTTGIKPLSYECSICYGKFDINDIAYSLFGRACIYPHVCKQCYMPIEEEKEAAYRKRILSELGLKYHHDIGKIGYSYYEFVIFKNGKQEMLKIDADSVDNTENPATVRFRNLVNTLKIHYKNDPLFNSLKDFS